MHNNIHPLVFIKECCYVQVEVGDFLDCLVFNKELQAGFTNWKDRNMMLMNEALEVTMFMMIKQFLSYVIHKNIINISSVIKRLIIIDSRIKTLLFL